MPTDPVAGPRLSSRSSSLQVLAELLKAHAGDLVDVATIDRGAAAIRQQVDRGGEAGQVRRRLRRSGTGAAAAVAWAAVKEFSGRSRASAATAALSVALGQRAPGATAVVAIRLSPTAAWSGGIVAAALLTWKLCRDLSGADELETTKERIRHARSGPPAEKGQPA